MLTLACLGFLGVLRQWHSKALHQIRLDRCVAETALEFKEILVKIESSNRRMRKARAALTATWEPALRAALLMELQAEAALQWGIQTRWTWTQAKWLLPSACEGGHDLATPLPRLPFQLEPPDALGPRPSELLENSGELRIARRHPPRASAAKITREGFGRFTENAEWKAKWASTR